MYANLRILSDITLNYNVVCFRCRAHRLYGTGSGACDACRNQKRRAVQAVARVTPSSNFHTNQSLRERLENDAARIHVLRIVGSGYNTVVRVNYGEEGGGEKERNAGAEIYNVVYLM